MPHDAYCEIEIHFRVLPTISHVSAHVFTARTQLAYRLAGNARSLISYKAGM